MTDPRQAEEALRESEQRFKAFMDHLPAIAWIKDAALRYTYTNHLFEKKLDKSPHSAIARDDFEVFPEAPESVARTRENDLAVQRSGKPLQAIESGPSPDGTVHHWLSVKFPLPDPTGAIGVAGTAIDITDRFEADAEARRHAEEVRALLDRLITAQESERKRLAFALHDLIGQNLTALGIGLKHLENSLPGETGADIAMQLTVMSRTVAQTVDAIRGVMTELRPSALDEYGLLAALRSYAIEFQSQTSLQTIVECGHELRRLPSALELTLFRIVQEGLTNAAKHSGGSLVRVTLEQVHSVLRVVVEDDGQGFGKPAGARKTRHGGWGLPAIRERAEAYGGVMRIEQPGRGTRLIVDIPIP